MCLRLIFLKLNDLEKVENQQKVRLVLRKTFSDTSDKQKASMNTLHEEKPFLLTCRFRESFPCQHPGGAALSGRAAKIERTLFNLSTTGETFVNFQSYFTKVLNCKTEVGSTPPGGQVRKTFFESTGGQV